MRKASPEIATKFMQFFCYMIFIFAITIIAIMGISISENAEKRDYYITVSAVLGGLIICAIVGLITSFVIYRKRKKAFDEEREKRLQMVWTIRSSRS